MNEMIHNKRDHRAEESVIVGNWSFRFVAFIFIIIMSTAHGRFSLAGEAQHINFLIDILKVVNNWSCFYSKARETEKEMRRTFIFTIVCPMEFASFFETSNARGKFTLNIIISRYLKVRSFRIFSSIFKPERCLEPVFIARNKNRMKSGLTYQR